MIISSAPLRVSLSSSDHQPFSERFGGAALNFCINKRVYIFIRKRNDLEETRYRMSYSKTELCNDLDDIQLCLMRQSIKMVGIEDPLEIIYSSDLPHQLGLGTSTSMVAALLKGLYYYKNIGISNDLLFNHVYKLERELCGNAGGFQDGVTVWGGLNYLEGYPYNVKRNPVVLSTSDIENLKNHMLLIYTGNTGDSSTALQDQLSLLKCGETLEETLKIKRLVQEMYAMLQCSDFKPLDLVYPVREAWELKKRLSPTMVSDTILYIEKSAYGIDNHSAVRLIGGGAGRGLMLCIASPESIKQIKKSVAPLKTLDIEFDWDGVTTRRIY
jgi:D-glycero-alpha-D-manno-heptose-7-phosphate kinase